MGVIPRVNRPGAGVDVAHCSEATVKGVARAATRPFVCSHANLKEPDHPTATTRGTSARITRGWWWKAAG